jgi:peptide methionine sulfoxide reductase msrA/msrB
MVTMRRPLLAILLVACSQTPDVAADTAPKGPPVIRMAKPSLDTLRVELSALQLSVTQYGDTEPPFKNAYFDHHADGIYVDITTGQPLFSSRHKFDSGTGWPSFFQPIEPGVLFEKRDATHGMERVEVRSKIGDAHLGHVFDDGPKPIGLRYCINSAALRFIPVADLTRYGYAKYATAFQK